MRHAGHEDGGSGSAGFVLMSDRMDPVGCSLGQRGDFVDGVFVPGAQKAHKLPSQGHIELQLQDVKGQNTGSTLYVRIDLATPEHLKTASRFNGFGL